MNQNAIDQSLTQTDLAEILSAAGKLYSYLLACHESDMLPPTHVYHPQMNNPQWLKESADYTKRLSNMLVRDNSYISLSVKVGP